MAILEIIRKGTAVHAVDSLNVLLLLDRGRAVAAIADVHLKYSKYLSMKNYLAKLQRQPARITSA